MKALCFLTGIMAFVVVTSVAMAQQQCNWSPNATNINETCGNIGIGVDSAHVYNPLTVVGTGSINLANFINSTNTTWPTPYGAQFLLSNYNIVNGNYVSLNANTYDNGGTETRVTTIATVFTSHTTSAVSGDIVFATMNAGSFAERMRIGSAGNVAIGKSPDSTIMLDVSGTIRGGNVIAAYQDFAEWVPASGAMSPGTVVVLERTESNVVAPSSVAYDTAVAGVVSARPGVILGEPSPEKAQIATTGRVRVKVDASCHPVAVGDLLVTSDAPGMAMVSEPVDVGGVKIHRPGTLIGKALEPLAGGQGDVLVLLSLQ